MTQIQYVQTILDLTNRLNAALDVIAAQQASGGGGDNLSPEQEATIQAAVTASTLRAEAMENGGVSPISPVTGQPGTTVLVTMGGSGFVQGLTTVTASGNGITVGTVTVLSPTSLTVSLSISPNATGPYKLTAATPGVATTTATFAVTAVVIPLPTSVSPARGVQGTSVPVTVSGPNLGPGTTIAVSGTGVDVAVPVNSNPTSLTATLVIDPAAAAGDRTLTVTQNGVILAVLVFTVVAATVNAQLPVITSIAPSSAPAGATVAITLAGSNFTPDSLISINGIGAHGSVIVENPTSITAQFILDDVAVPGDRQVTITNSLGTSAPVTFTVGAVAAGTPVISVPAAVTAKMGQPVNIPVTATNMPVVFSATGLPAGLNIDPVTGTITGTSLAAKVSNVILTATNATGVGTALVTLTIAF